MKEILRVLYLTSYQINVLIAVSRAFARVPLIGKALSILTDNLMLVLYGIELTSSSLNIGKLVVGHSAGVVLGGNGIRCNGTLHLSSGVVFGRRFGKGDAPEPEVFFDIDGDLTVGANSVLLGPLKIKGPTTIGALTLVAHDIETPGLYVGTPARRLDRAPLSGDA
jgi:serine acetyltransferase